jgi:ribosomal protein L33
MKNKDMILTCQRCRSQFYFTVGEQNFYKQKGLNIPKYCKRCRGQQQVRQSIERTPKACSTCYFCVRACDWTYRYTGYPGDYDYCSRSGGKIINDAPCKYWTKG